jgi:toxin ParE1/3/4
MSKPMVVEPEAEADLKDAYLWYQKQREGLGDDFLLCYEAAPDAIGQWPRAYPVVGRHSRRILLRRFPYSVLYVELPEVIAVLGVFNTSRHPKVWRRRLK